MPRDSLLQHANDRCAMTSRPGNCLSRWRVSRLIWRSLADYNQLSGVKRASWGVPTRNSFTFIYKRFRPNLYNTEGYSKHPVVDRNGKIKYVQFRFVN
jgi:ribosomal protein S14